MSKNLLRFVLVMYTALIGVFVWTGIDLLKMNLVGQAVIMFLFAAASMVVMIFNIVKISKFKDLKVTDVDRKALASWLYEQKLEKCSLSVRITKFSETTSELRNDGRLEEVGKIKTNQTATVTTSKGDVCFPIDNDGEIVLEKFRVIVVGPNYALIYERNNPWVYQLYQRV